MGFGAKRRNSFGKCPQMVRFFWWSPLGGGVPRGDPWGLKKDNNSSRLDKQSVHKRSGGRSVLQLKWLSDQKQGDFATENLDVTSIRADSIVVTEYI